MSCCGNKRATVSYRTGPTNRQGGEGAPSGRYAHAFFQYLGQTALTVTGPVSGNPYRFSRPGAIVAVDPRDMRSLMGLAQIRLVRQP